MWRIPRIGLPWDQTRAVDNARAASRALSRQRVAREEVEIYLERRLAGRRALDLDWEERPDTLP